MKFKKLIVGITVLAALVVTGCSKQQKKSATYFNQNSSN